MAPPRDDDHDPTADADRAPSLESIVGNALRARGWHGGEDRWFAPDAPLRWRSIGDAVEHQIRLEGLGKP
jgi:hypothetical protein